MRDLSVNKGTAVSAADGFLPFTNDFIFGMVMRNPKVCMDFLKTVLPDEDFSEVDCIIKLNNLIKIHSDASVVECKCSNHNHQRSHHHGSCIFYHN